MRKSALFEEREAAQDGAVCFSVLGGEHGASIYVHGRQFDITKSALRNGRFGSHNRQILDYVKQHGRARKKDYRLDGKEHIDAIIALIRGNNAAPDSIEKVDREPDTAERESPMSSKALSTILHGRMERRPVGRTGVTEVFSTSDLIAKIRAYQEKHRELLKSHHFVFDCPLDGTNVAKPDFIWFGVNPGKDDEDWHGHPSNCEESRDFDFQAELGRSTASKNRMAKLRRFLGDDMFRRTTHCELFFWCSKDTGSAFKERYGYTFDSNPHWDFCCAINKSLVERVKPVAVLAESRPRLPIYERRLNLRPGRVYETDEGDVLVEERWFDGDIPFYCFDHLSALSTAISRRPAVKDKIAALLQARERRRAMRVE